MTFPIDLSTYTPLRFSLTQEGLTGEQRATLASNIRLVRDAIVSLLCEELDRLGDDRTPARLMIDNDAHSYPVVARPAKARLDAAYCF